MAVLLTVFLILHLGIGLVLPHRPGDKPRFYKWIETAGRDLEHRLNRVSRPQSVRLVRGTAVGIVLGLLGAAVGLLVHYTAAQVPRGILVNLVFLALCVDFIMPLKLARTVRRNLEAGRTPRAAAVLQMYLQEAVDPRDAHAVVRKTIEFIALTLNDFLMGPVFWFLLGGPVGMAVYVTFSALRHAFSYSDPRRRYFGSFVRLVDQILNLVPGALSVLFLTAGALFVHGANPLSALRLLFTRVRSRHHGYRHWLIAAAAGGLGVTLGGPVRYASGHAEDTFWIGAPRTTALLTPQDLARAALLQYVFFMGVLGVAAFAIILSII